MKRFGNLLVLAAFLATAAAASDIYPPHQFRLVNPEGRVEIRGDGANRVGTARAEVGAGETVITAKGARATFRVIDIGDLHVNGGTKVKVESVDPDGRPVFRVLSGRVLAKTRAVGAARPLEVRLGKNGIEVQDGIVEVVFNSTKKAGKLSLLKGGSKVVTAKGRKDLPTTKSLFVFDSGKVGARALDKAGIRGGWDTFGAGLFQKDVGQLGDSTAPRVRFTKPEDGYLADRATITIAGTVDDPTIQLLKLNVDGALRSSISVVGGNFESKVTLEAERQTLTAIAVDRAGNSGEAALVVRCSVPSPRAAGAGGEAAGGLVARIKAAIKDPAKDPVAIGGLALTGLFGLGVLVFVVRKGFGGVRKASETAAGLATGVIFNRCESCNERHFEYHLFYTTEPVTSPFMRNLINNVNPMATSIMNESLENLLNTGLQGSAGAKGADQKIRVTCTWCDQCKVGNLKLEHMKSGEVVKTDDYQIIHPIFIEWVRKVYD